MVLAPSSATASQAAATAATAAIATTLPAVFDARNIPANIRVRCDTFRHLTDILTQTAIVPFTTPSDGCGPVLSYLDPPLGAGAMSSPTDANRIIIWNGPILPFSGPRQ